MIVSSYKCIKSNRCMLTFLLVASLTFCTVIGDEVDGNDPHFYEFIRPRLGHFSRANGYLRIYEEYKENILAQNDRQLAKIGVNDWRNLRPTGELCIDFLTGFQVKDYTLVKPHDIIMLDACLDWLYDTSREKQLDLDRFNAISKSDNEKLKEDEELKKIFTKTKFKGDLIPIELKEKLHEYFAKTMKIHADNPKSGCNGLYLAAYDDFIEDVYLGDCEQDDKCEYFSKFATGMKKEPYLDLIIDSTKQATKSCYGVVQKQMVDYMHQAFEDEPMQASIQRKFKTINSAAARQSVEMKWGREMMRILQLASNKNEDDVVDLTEVVKVLKGVQDDDDEIKESFTSAVGAYAIKKIDTKDTAGDANGRARFGQAMRDLCKPYIDRQSFIVRTGGSQLWEDDPTSKRKPFEFFDMVYSLIRITNHMSFYKVTKEKFEKDILKNGWEALYMATFACQMISTVWGEISYDSNKPEFNVVLRKSFHDLIDDWPIDVMYEEYMKKAGESSAPSSQENSSSSSGSGGSGGSGNLSNKSKFKLGKFKLRKTNSKKGRKDDDYEPEPETAAVQSSSPEVAQITPALQDPEPIQSQPQPEESADTNKKHISLDSLKMFRNLHGRYPKEVPEAVRQKYASSLPSDLSGTYPKTLDLNDETKQPSKVVPLAFNLNQGFDPKKGVVGKNQDGAKSQPKWQNIDVLSM